MTTDAEFKAQVRQVRSYTSRIRQATRELPRVAAEEGWNIDSDKENLRALLHEILGCATGIAEELQIDL